MKNTFNILYYTGISIMMVFVLIISLFAMNIQNILLTFTKDRPQVNPYVKDSSAYVIKPVQKQPVQIPTNKPKVNQQSPSIKKEDIIRDSNQTEVASENQKLLEEPKDSSIEKKIP